MNIKDRNNFNDKNIKRLDEFLYSTMMLYNNQKKR